MKFCGFLSLALIWLITAFKPGKTQQVVSAQSLNTSVALDALFDDEVIEKTYPYVVSLKFHLKEETLPELFSKLALRSMPCPQGKCGVSLLDIADVIQPSRFTTEVLAEAVGKLNITSDDACKIPLLYSVNVTMVEDLLQTFALTFSGIYNNFVKSLATPYQTIPEVLRIVNVSVNDFMNAQLYGTDSTRLQVLSTGVYSQENLLAILRATNKTGVDMLKMLPLTDMTSQLNKLGSRALRNFVKNLGVTSNNLLDLYRYLNVTFDRFLSSPSCIRAMTDIYEFLNPEEVLGTIVSSTRVVTSNNAKALKTFQTKNSELVRNFSNFHTELVENFLVQYDIKNVILSNSEYQAADIAFAETLFPLITSIAEVSKVFNAPVLYNCTYVSKLPFGGLYTEAVPRANLDRYTIAIPKSNSTVFNLGSPLFCREKLCGIASAENVTHLIFSTLLKNSPSTSPSPPSEKPAVSGNVTSPSVVTVPRPSAAAALGYSVFSSVVVLAALLLS